MPDPKKVTKKIIRPDTPLAPTPTPYNFKEAAEQRSKNDSIVATNKYLKYHPNEGTREAKSEGNRIANQTRLPEDKVIKSKDKYGQDKYTRNNR